MRKGVLSWSARLPEADIDAVVLCTAAAVAGDPKWLSLSRDRRGVVLGVSVGQARKAAVMTKMSREELDQLQDWTRCVCRGGELPAPASPTPASPPTPPPLTSLHGELFPDATEHFWAQWNRVTDNTVAVVFSVDKCALQSKLAGSDPAYAPFWGSIENVMSNQVFVATFPLAGAAPCSGTGVNKGCRSLGTDATKMKALYPLVLEHKVVAAYMGLPVLGAVSLSRELTQPVLVRGGRVPSDVGGAVCPPPPHPSPPSYPPPHPQEWLAEKLGLGSCQEAVHYNYMSIARPEKERSAGVLTLELAVLNLLRQVSTGGAGGAGGAGAGGAGGGAGV